MENKDLKAIMVFIEDHYGLKRGVLMKNTRRMNVAAKRQQAHWLARKYIKATLSEIGYNIGRRDHGTVLNSIKAVNNALETDVNYKRKFNVLEQKFKDILLPQLRSKKPLKTKIDNLIIRDFKDAYKNFKNTLERQKEILEAEDRIEKNSIEGLIKDVNFLEKDMNQIKLM